MTLTFIIACLNAALAGWFAYMGAETRLTHFYGLAVFNGLCALLCGMAFAGGIQ